MAESKEELKSLLMKVKEESEKAVLKVNIQKTKIMASGPITSWQTDGKTVETVTDFIWGRLQPWNQKMLALWKKSYDQPRQHIKKQRHYFANKVMVFPTVCVNVGEGNGNPIQYSCLENSVNRGAWWAAVHGVAQSQTWLKRLSSSSSSYVDHVCMYVCVCVS